jgi:hypothetical protein
MIIRVIQIFALICIVMFISESQNTKRGGIYFRVDDDQSVQNWKEYAKVFDKYGYKFGFALNLGLLNDRTDYYQMIRDFQANGHEMQDHTPNHRTLFFTDPNAIQYQNHPAIHHINGDTVCLRYSSIDTSAEYSGEGLANIKGCVVISKDKGAFKLFGLQTIYSRIYFPTLNLLCGFSKVLATNSDDADTLYIKSNWQEFISLPEIQNVPFQIISSYDIQIPDDGVELLGKRTLDLCQKNNIQRPYTWIQPGGLFTQLPRDQIKRVFGDKLNYTAGANTKNPVAKTYNLYDPQNDSRFGWDWADFNEDLWSLSKVKNIIADKIAKHYVLSGHSHFLNLLGGWGGYLDRMDSLLGWCLKNNIPIKTQNDWTHLLYDLPTNPYENIMPPLNVDLDDNGVPDGFYYQTGYTYGMLDSTDGVDIDGGYSLSMPRNGTICEISKLGGLEKGELEFSIWIKGSAGNAVQVKFTFPENGVSTVFLFPVTGSEWKKYTLSQSVNGSTKLVVPDSISFVNIFVSCPSIKNPPVKISGMELRKKIERNIQIVSSPLTRVNLGKPYRYEIKYICSDSTDSVTVSADSLPEWLTLTSNKLLTGIAPKKKNDYPVRIIAHDIFGNADTQSFSITVKNMSHFSLNTSNINMGTLSPNIQKDTTIYMANLGSDSLFILNYEFNSSLINCSIPSVFPPGKVEYLNIAVSPQQLGAFNGRIVVFFEQNEVDIDTIFIQGLVAIINQEKNSSTQPATFSVSQNYPNPFNAGTVLNYTLKSESKVSMIIYNMLGQAVKVVKSQDREPAGYYQLHWNGDADNGISLSSGVYLCRTLISPTDGSSQKEFVKKMLLLR